MYNILKYSMLFSISLLLSGCIGMLMMGGQGSPMGGMMGMMNHDSMEMESKDNNSSIDKSYIITKRYCTQCHEMKQTTLHTQKDWDKTINRMLGYMKQQDKLQPDDYELVMIEHYYDDTDMSKGH